MANKFQVSYIYNLVDKLSPNLKKISENARKSADKLKKIASTGSPAMERLGRSVNKAQTKLKGFNQQLQKIKTGSLMASASATAMTYKMINNFDKQAMAQEGVRVGLETTRKAANLTYDTLIKKAGELQKKTLFGDEQILGGITSQLLTFTNIKGNQFLETQQAVLDVASRLSLTKGGQVDLTSTAIQLGKALNDPVANLGALGRSGIQFSKSQKEIIKSLVETNRLSQAQDIILKELKKQYGGTAEAMSKVGAGALKQLRNAFGDFLEDIGKRQFKVLQPFIDNVKKLQEKFNNLSEGSKDMIAKLVLITTVAYPLIVALGVLAIALKAIGGAALFVGKALKFGLFGKISLVIGGIQLLIYSLNKLKEMATNIMNYFNNKFNISDKIGKVMSFFKKGGGEKDNLNMTLNKNILSDQKINIGADIGINFKNAPENMSSSITQSQENPFSLNINQSFAR